MTEGKSKGKPGTRLVGAGRRKEWTSVPGKPGGVVNPPVWRASTHLFEDAADIAAGRPNEDGQFYYGMRGGPTHWSLADALTEIEPGAAGTVLYPSGLAAIAGALLAVLRQGDVLLMADNVYHPSRKVADGILKRLGIETRYFDPLDLDSYTASFCDRTRAVLLETPGSLTMEVCDIPAQADLARRNGAVSLIDNTWAGPLGFPALERGCDISIMALTKHVGGHSDLMMGSVSAGEDHLQRQRLTAQTLGQVVSPDDAALALRGLRTMDMRLQRSTQSALTIATWLESRPEVAAVLCPMLPGSQGHEIWKRDFTGGSGLFSFVLKGRDEAARARFIDTLNLFGIGYSFGGFESLVTALDLQGARSIMRWPPEGLAPSNRLGIRLWIGLEDVDDLIADLETAFKAMEQE